MSTNRVERPLVINGKLELIPLDNDYADTFTGVAAQDLDRHGDEIKIFLQVLNSDSTAGLIAIEESDGKGVWTRIWSRDIVGGGITEFVTLKRTKRYIRVPNPGLDADTTTCMALTLFY